MDSKVKKVIKRVKMIFFKIFLFYIFRESLSIISLFLNIRNNRILFIAFNGKQYSCNPKYITEYLLENSKQNYEIIWVLNRPKKDFPKNIKTVKFMDFKYIYYYFTSKIIVTNIGFKSFLKKPKNQIRIETWHGGGAYKKVNLDVAKNSLEILKYKTIGKEINYYITSCNKFSKVMSKAQFVKLNKFVKSGMPRNDIFFSKNKIETISNNVKEIYNLDRSTKIILYAPTWRDNGTSLKINDIYEIIENLSIKNKIKYILLYRAHYSSNTIKELNKDNLINVTDYPDMQELLCAADILITDYSSCMWDFSLMYKPCFIYATDIDQYKQERDFYTPMSEWPFPIATNTDELINNIINFNEKEYIEKVKKHHKALGSYEDGHACERVCKLIEDIIDGKV